MSIGNRLTNFLFTIGATIVSVLGRGELISDHSIYNRFLNSPSKSWIDEYDSIDYKPEKEQTPVRSNVKYNVKLFEPYQYESQPD